MRFSARPSGAYLTPGMKMRCANLVHPPLTCWAWFWNTGWDQSPSGRIITMLNLAVLAGATTVKVAGAGFPQSGIQSQYNDVAPSDAVLRSRMQWLWQQIRQRNLRLFYNFGGPGAPSGTDANGSKAVSLAIAAKIAGWLAVDAKDILQNADPVNEANNNGSVWASTAAAAPDMLAWYGAIRPQLPGLPMGFSTLVSSDSDIRSNAWIGLQRTVSSAYNDIHTYYQVGPSYTLAGVPTLSGFAALEARSDALPYNILGEMGCGTSTATPSAAQIAIQTATINYMGDVARRPRSLGANFFVIGDYYSDTNYYGMYDASLANPRPQVIVPFGRWPSSV